MVKPGRSPRRLRAGARLDKYRVITCLGQGGFSTVYAAYDTLEGRDVALKLPHPHLYDSPMAMERLMREIKINARLEHPGILGLKNASFIDGRLVMAFPIGVETLAQRLARRLSRQTAWEWALQMIDAIAFAHENRVLHLDIKPENFILFDEHRIRLADFGLARLARGEINASGSGTLGYIAPEQAMGRPSFRSDVFSLGLVLYRMLSGELPKYPFSPPLPGIRRLRRSLNPELLEGLKKAIEPIPARRFRDVVAMRNAICRLRRPFRSHLSGHNVS
jgi:serine/threonine-protein kinase